MDTVPYDRPDMILTMAPARARWGARIRLATLVAVALLLAHTAIYAAEDGLGAAYAAAMSRDGHGTWWVVVAMVIGLLGLAAGALSAARLARLEIRAIGRRRRRTGDPHLGHEAIAIARRLVPIVLVLFAIQENLEQLAAHGRFLGVEAIVGPAHPLAVPVLVAVCLALSAAGALVRWRIATLRRRIANGPARGADRRIRPLRIDPRWRTIGSLAPLGRMLVRLDAGRSPPSLLQP